MLPRSLQNVVQVIPTWFPCFLGLANQPSFQIMPSIQETILHSRFPIATHFFQLSKISIVHTYPLVAHSLSSLKHIPANQDGSRRVDPLWQFFIGRVMYRVCQCTLPLHISPAEKDWTEKTDRLFLGNSRRGSPEAGQDKQETWFSLSLYYQSCILECAE
jgi:hypothetical protein